MQIISTLSSLRAVIHSQGAEFLQAGRLLSPAGYRQFIQTSNEFKELLMAFYVHGGLALDTKTTNTSDKTPVVIRTVIQADGDIYSFISKKLFKYPECWENHVKTIQHTLKHYHGCINRLKATLCGLANWLSLLLIPLILTLWKPSDGVTLYLGIYCMVWSALYLVLRSLFYRIGIFWIRKKLPISL